MCRRYYIIRYVRGRQVVDNMQWYQWPCDQNTLHLSFGVRYAKPIRRCTMITDTLIHTHQQLFSIYLNFSVFESRIHSTDRGREQTNKNSGILWSLVNVFFPLLLLYLLLLPFLRLINFQLLCCVCACDAIAFAYCCCCSCYFFILFLYSFFIPSLIWILHNLSHTHTYAL